MIDIIGFHYENSKYKSPRRGTRLKCLNVATLPLTSCGPSVVRGSAVPSCGLRRPVNLFDLGPWLLALYYSELWTLSRCELTWPRSMAARVVGVCVCVCYFFYDDKAMGTHITFESTGCSCPRVQLPSR